MGKDEIERRLQGVFEETEIVRPPLRGIVSGYHKLPFVLIGPAEDEGCVEVSGTINVSPRLVIPARALRETFGEIFTEDEGFMDTEIVGRSFQIPVVRDPSRQVRSADLRIEKHPGPWGERIEGRLDEMMRRESTGTALIRCPEPRFYPVSLEKFIFSILRRELGP